MPSNPAQFDQILDRIASLIGGGATAVSEPCSTQDETASWLRQSATAEGGDADTDAVAAAVHSCDAPSDAVACHPAPKGPRCDCSQEYSNAPVDGEFWPLVPPDWETLKITPSTAEELALKHLLSVGTSSGRDISDHIALPFGLLSDLLSQLKANRLVTYRGAAEFNDYIYQLTDSGIEVARRCIRQCGYVGAAPIALEDYTASVEQQSIRRNPPLASEILGTFDDLVLCSDTLDQIGQAIRGGDGFFLYGNSGNGKTSVAERVTRAFGRTIWIPRSLRIDGQIIRVFDPCNHIEVPPENKDGLYDKLKIDRRWVRIRRPTIMAGGELTMDRLEIRPSAVIGVYEAPLQLKSNCGTLVIDDLGRQRMKPDELLNRWIVPLDRGFDILNLSNGKAIQVPFDQLLIFSTNMQPYELVDEAFLRRLPYKIEIQDPTESEFREIFWLEAQRQGIPLCTSALDDLIRSHYVGAKRPFRCCHPRDLLRQVKSYCVFKQIPLAMSPERFATAVRNYFAVSGKR